MTKESHVAAVLCEKDEFARNGSKKLFKDETGAQHKRRKIFDRELTFSVVIGDYNDDAVEKMFEDFITSLDKGLTVDGNFIPIEVSEADWVDKDDSILMSKLAVQVSVTFNGGVYRDTGFAHVTGLEVDSVIKEGENQDGK